VQLAAGKAAEVEVVLRLPQVRDGVIFDTQLDLRLISDEEGVDARQTRPVRVFPVDPFAVSRQWLGDIDILLLDPSGRTEREFRAAGIPYKLVRRIEVVGDRSRGALIIGEGTSLADHRGLAESLVQRAVAGMTVICLMPADGNLPFPGTGNPLSRPTSVSLRRNDWIHALDKRVDAAAWAPGGRFSVTGLVPAQSRDRFLLTVHDSPDSWPWLEATYPGNGRFIVCGFGIIQHWERGPSPRYLLANVLEYVASDATLDLSPKEENN
jgi:hypothetical protein